MVGTYNHIFMNREIHKNYFRSTYFIFIITIKVIIFTRLYYFYYKR